MKANIQLTSLRYTTIALNTFSHQLQNNSCNMQHSVPQAYELTHTKFPKVNLRRQVSFRNKLSTSVSSGCVENLRKVYNDVASAACRARKARPLSAKEQCIHSVNFWWLFRILNSSRRIADVARKDIIMAWLVTCDLLEAVSGSCFQHSCSSFEQKFSYTGNDPITLRAFVQSVGFKF